MSIPGGALKTLGLHRFDDLVWAIFGFRGDVAIGALQERAWLFCRYSATMVDRDGATVGKLGLRDDGVCLVSIMGKGCSYVRDWQHVHDTLDQVQAHLTRVDIAVDDLEGDAFDVERFRAMYHAGDFNMGGRNPNATYVSDEGSGKGNSLTIGQKGNKQLQVYEKGRQLGDRDSKHVRCELRLWRNKIDLPLDALVNPGTYYGAAYSMLAEFIAGEVEKLDVRERNVNATAKAMVACLKNQSGTAIGLLLRALGDEASEFVLERVARVGRPARFKAIPGDIEELIREQLRSGADENHDQRYAGGNP